MENLINWKIVWASLGGLFGWFVAEFRPTFPLMVVVVILIISDAWSAFQLDKRVHARYPDKVKRRKAKFTSFAFGKVVKKTIPQRLWLIILSFIVEHWIFIHVNIPLSYIVAGAIAFEQILSIFENEASCRENEEDSRLWRVLRSLLIDKTERHWDIDLSELKDKGIKEENNNLDNEKS